MKADQLQTERGGGTLKPARWSGPWVWRTAEVFSHLAIATFFVAVFLRQAWDVYVIDETAFPSAAAGAAETGVPYFYNGETRPQDLGLWHPPLYVYSLAAWIFAFGDEIPVVRSFGMVMVLIAWVIGLAAVSQTFGRPAAWARMSFSAVLLTNPLIINGALTPDIDGVWGIPVMVLAVWLGLWIISTASAQRSMLLWVTAFAYLATWSKFTIALMLLPPLLLAALLRADRRVRTLLTVVGGAAVGSVAAIASWWLVAEALGAPFEPPFEYFWVTLVDTDPASISGGTRLSTFFEVDPAIFWIGPFLLIVVLLVSCWLLAAGGDTVRRRTLFLLGTTVFLILGYALITGSPFQHPKYWGVAVVSAAMLLAMGALQELDRQRWRLRGSLPVQVLLASAIAAALLVAARRLYPEIAETLATAARSERILIEVGAVLFSIALLGGLIALVTPGAGGARRIATVAVAAGLVAVTAQQAMVAVAVARADYNTRHYFGEQGLAEVIAYLREEAPPGASLVSAKDVGLQSELPFYEDWSLFYGMTLAEFETFLQTQQPMYFVTRNRGDYSQVVFPEQFAVIDRFYNPVAEQPGRDFTIWRWAGTP